MLALASSTTNVETNPMDRFVYKVTIQLCVQTKTKGLRGELRCS